MSKKDPKNQLSELEKEGLGILTATSLQGRQFTSPSGGFHDFCNTSYLGIDLDERLYRQGLLRTRDWGAVSGWSRLEIDPVIYPSLEASIAELVGAERAMLSHTITITNFSLIPPIVGKGAIFADQKVHMVVWEACRLARDHGAQLHRFRHQDLNDLERLLAANRDVFPKLIAVDGVYSISTELAPVRELQQLAAKYGAWLYVDDAHGFGILGREPGPENPYGTGGGGIVSHFGGEYGRTFYVSSFNKAFCTQTAFATIPVEYTESLATRSLQYIFSSPVSPFILGTVEAAMQINREEGEARRARLRQLVTRFVDGLSSLGLRFRNEKLQPVVFVEVGTLEQMKKVVPWITTQGLVAGIRAYPLVPENECGLRFALTALHTEAQVDFALSVLGEAPFRTNVNLAA
jgi:8-amino-7-oxononanoate synthase